MVVRVSMWPMKKCEMMISCKALPSSSATTYPQAIMRKLPMLGLGDTVRKIMTLIRIISDINRQMGKRRSNIKCFIEVKTAVNSFSAPWYRLLTQAGH